jgi:hypothetical protein
MRSLVIEHAAQITAINPSAAGLALEEMFGFVLVRIGVLGNIFFARDLHSSLSLICAFPNACLLRRFIKHPVGISIESPQHTDAHMHQRSMIFCGHDQRLDRAVCHASRFCSAFGSFMM